MTEEVMGGPPFKVGDIVRHPDGRRVKITDGQYWGEYGLSNFWYWREVKKGGRLARKVEHGYGWDPKAKPPEKKEKGATTLAVGDTVVVVDFDTKKPLSTSTHTVVDVLNQKNYPGGVTIDPPFDGIVHWNEDSLRAKKRKARR
jgi:hypothetical protein